LHKPDLPTALLACQDRPACSASVLESADGWCYRHRETCPTTLDPARLDAAEALVRSDRYALQWLQRLRTRATGG
jgi:hypothetical protein